MTKCLTMAFLLSATSVYAQLSDQLDSLMQATIPADRPGAALLVVVDGKAVYQKGYGLANQKTKAAISPKTNFRMASVSKQFTAMGILLLEKDRKLSLDDPLIRFFPEWQPTVGKKVRISHLLTHTSGVLDYESVMNSNQKEQLLDADVLRLLKDQDSVYFEPGSQFRYSNSAYCLLALLIERVSGLSFATFIKQRIFQPLHMTESVVYEAGKPIPNRAMGYRKQGNAYVFSDQSLTSATKGDGGVYTSLTDYRKWIEALQTNTLLNLNAVLARTGKAIRSYRSSYYGAGWFYQQPASPILFHSGTTCGFNNFVVSIPSSRFLMAYFSNRADNKANAEAVIRILAKALQPEISNILALDELTQ
ncbi:serine hydrolase domain-containing protein [Spirosoma sp. SC4-14]|uniref:serine hydrolase domain-containing protein n=1 Tax=Spirosoma sp. SC4-14 TaxID=3128900 RepID=UPI0030CA98F9